MENLMSLKDAAFATGYHVQDILNMARECNAVKLKPCSSDIMIDADVVKAHLESLIKEELMELNGIKEESLC